MAIADLAALSSVRIAGSVTEDGHAGFVDVTLGPNGCRATERIPGQVPLDVIVIGKTMWFKSGGQLWPVKPRASSQHRTQPARATPGSGIAYCRR